MKTILTALLVLFAAVGASAQTPIRISVGGNTDAQEIYNHLNAKIGGTSGYAVGLPAPLSVDVNCIPLRPEEGGPVTGHACASVVDYLPDIGALSIHLGGAETIVSCPSDGEACAEALFESFVHGTEPDRLAAAKAQLQRDVNEYIQSRQPEK